MNRVARTGARLDERTTAGLALGVAGLFMFNIVCGPFAIGLGIASYRRAVRDGEGGRGRQAAALLSVALGLADLVVLAVLTLTRMHGGQFLWPLG